GAHASGRSGGDPGGSAARGGVARVRRARGGAARPGSPPGDARPGTTSPAARGPRSRPAGPYRADGPPEGPPRPRRPALLLGHVVTVLHEGVALDQSGATGVGASGCQRAPGRPP